MTAGDGKKLAAGDRVKWVDGSLGNVHEVSYAAVKVAWDDNQWSLMTFDNPRTPWQNLSKEGP